MSAALQTFDLVKRFGGIVATDHVTFTLERGARHALIGPNGAGKTTFINQLTGVLAPTSGRIVFEGADIAHLKPETRVRRGIARTFQINQLFPDLTPLEALTLAVNERLQQGHRGWRRLGRISGLAADIADIAERFGLADVLNVRTGSLAYGRQRQLEIAVAFAARPRVLLLCPRRGSSRLCNFRSRWIVFACIGAFTRIANPENRSRWARWNSS